MDFSFSESQEMLRKMAREFLSKQCPKSRVKALEKDEKGYGVKAWAGMAELGWQGLVIPEKYDGSGSDFLDLMILLEEMGRNILPGPFFPTVAYGALPLIRFGREKQKADYLPGIAKGQFIFTLAACEGAVSYEMSDIGLRVTRDGDEYVIEGDKCFVPDAHVADYILVAGRTSRRKNPANGITLFIINAGDPSVVKEAVPTIGGDRQFTIHFNKTRAGATDILGTRDRGSEVLTYIYQVASVLKCAEVSGACQAIVDMTSAYARERVQFNRPIGSFQAVQIKLADMQVAAESLQHLVYQAAWGISAGVPSSLHISMAKTYAEEAYHNICVEGITIHGAIGITMDCDLGLYYRRVRGTSFAGGDADYHRAIIASQIGL